MYIDVASRFPPVVRLVNETDRYVISTSDSDCDSADFIVVKCRFAYSDAALRDNVKASWIDADGKRVRKWTDLKGPFQRRRQNETTLYVPKRRRAAAAAAESGVYRCWVASPLYAKRKLLRTVSVRAKTFRRVKRDQIDVGDESQPDARVPLLAGTVFIVLVVVVGVGVGVLTARRRRRSPDDATAMTIA